jgi:hypothetical protein
MPRNTHLNLTTAGRARGYREVHITAREGAPGSGTRRPGGSRSPQAPARAHAAATGAACSHRGSIASSCLQVDVALPPEALAAAHWGPSKLSPGTSMTITAQGMEPLQVPLLRRPDSEIRCEGYGGPVMGHHRDRFSCCFECRATVYRYKRRHVFTVFCPSRLGSRADLSDPAPTGPVPALAPGRSLSGSGPARVRTRAPMRPPGSAATWACPAALCATWAPPPPLGRSSSSCRCV